MDFLDFRDHTNNSFFINKIAKFHDQIIINQIILAHQFNNDELPSDLKKLFTHTFDIHSHNTRGSYTSMLHIPMIKSTHFGKQSLKFIIPITFNTIMKNLPDISIIKSIHALKKDY